jgi:checkpoint serine/threonine-protein kinase
MSSNGIVQMEDIYDKKENIIPLKEGRRAKTLSESQSPAQLEIAHQQFQTALADPLNDDSNDPLEIYHCYLKWMKEHYPSGHKSLPKLLETTCRRFKRDERYRNDPRYLNMWLMTARKTESPVDLFKYLALNRIGDKLSEYYEDYASLLESRNRYIRGC